MIESGEKNFARFFFFNAHSRSSYRVTSMKKCLLFEPITWICYSLPLPLSLSRCPCHLHEIGVHFGGKVMHHTAAFEWHLNDGGGRKTLFKRIKEWMEMERVAHGLPIGCFINYSNHGTLKGLEPWNPWTRSSQFVCVYIYSTSHILLLSLPS